MLHNWRIRLPLAVAAVLGASTIAVVAGGFWISIQNPSTLKDKDPVAARAVVLVRADGCHNPAEALISGNAEGLVNGVRKSIPLKLERLSQPATYAVTPQWPAEGVWVLNIKGTYLGRTTGALVEITRHKFEKESAKLFPREATAEEIEASLKSLARQTIAKNN